MKRLMSFLLIFALVFALAGSCLAEQEPVRVILSDCETGEGWIATEGGNYMTDASISSEGKASWKLETKPDNGMFFFFAGPGIDATGADYLVLDFYTDDANVFQNAADCGINVGSIVNDWDGSGVGVTVATLKNQTLTAGEWNHLILPLNFTTATDKFDIAAIKTIRFYAVGLNGTHTFRVDNVLLANEAGLKEPEEPAPAVKVRISDCDDDLVWPENSLDREEYTQGKGSIREDTGENEGMFFLLSGKGCDITGADCLTVQFYTDDAGVFQTAADCGINLANDAHWDASGVAVTAAALKAQALQVGWNSLTLPITRLPGAAQTFDPAHLTNLRFYAVGLTGKHTFRIDNLYAVNQEGMALPDLPDEEPIETGDYVVLDQAQQALFDRSYQTLADRVDERGYAPTSLEGGDFVSYGMFTRDSFTQALAHIAKGDYDLARKILRYQLSYHVNAGYSTIVRYVPDLQDEECGKSFGKTQTLTGLVSLGGPKKAVQQIKAEPGAFLTGAELYLSKTGAAAGTITAHLYKSVGDNSGLDNAQHIDVQTLSVEEIPEEGGWVKILFQLPMEQTAEGNSYYLTLQAADAPAGSVVWHGADGGTLFTAQQTDGKWSELSGELSYNALFSTLGSKLVSENWPQGDCNSLLALAWARFAKEAPHTEENLAFLQESYPLVKEYALYYVFAKDAGGNPYWNEELNLLREPCLEHSRVHEEYLPTINSLFNGYNLWSSVFASQAFYEMVSIAWAMGDDEGAKIFDQYDRLIVKGIKENLVCEFEGKQIYAELIDADHNNQLIPGFSWLSLTPAAAQWHAIDWEMMANTFESYQKYGVNGIGSKDILDSTVYLDSQRYTKSGLTYAETIAATAMYYYFGAGQVDRAQAILDTVARLAGDIYFETVNVNGGKSDIGNQSHCSWMCLAVIKLTAPQKDTDVTFAADGADRPVLPVRVQKGEQITLPNIERRFYRLTGFTCGGESFEPGETVTIEEDMTFTALFEQVEEPYTLGDVDHNGSIDSVDALAILRYNVGLEPLSETQRKAADVDKNGGIDSLDALRVLQLSVGILDSFQTED